MAHFVTAFIAAPTPWAVSTSFGFNGVCIPTPPNGSYYLAALGGETGWPMQPHWPTKPGASVGPDGSVAEWVCQGTIEGNQLAAWDAAQAASVNGDLGGTWSPSSPITFLTTNNGCVFVSGLTQITSRGKLLVTGGAVLSLGNGFPRNGPTHLGRKRRIVTPCELGLSDTPLGVRPDFSLSALAAVACAVTSYVASDDDSSVSVSAPSPVRWALPLDVHDTGTLVDVVLTYRPKLGTPRARVVAIDPTGLATPLTSAALGADASGYVTPPDAAPTTATTAALDALDAAVVRAIVAAGGTWSPGASASPTAGVVEWTIHIDGGAAGANAVVDRDGFTYLLEVTEDATQTGYPGTIPVLSPVYLATTGPIDMALAPSTIDDASPIPVGARILIKDQPDPAENGIYLFPGVGLPFAVATFTPIARWRYATSYGVNDLVQPLHSNGMFYKATAVGGSGGVSAGHLPGVWPIVTGDFIIDNPGAHQITWTCEGLYEPYTYLQVVEIRTYGLLQGSAVQVIGGSKNAGTAWQYFGSTIKPEHLGSVPALGWGTIPTGLDDTGADAAQDAVGSFAASGNRYHAAACDHALILTQAFQ